MLINLTPHDIIVFSAVTGETVAEIHPYGLIARVEKTDRQVDAETVAAPGFGGDGETWEYNIPVMVSSLSAVSGLPNEQAGVRFIVSAQVRVACPDRLDLVSPADLVRDEAGNVIGCRAFEANNTF